MNEPLLAFTGKVILPDRLLPDGVVLCAGGRIAAVGSAGEVTVPGEARVIAAAGGFVSPGYVDIHVHGGAGADYMDGTRQAMITANRAHARHGTTSIFPTTTTG